MVLNVGIIDDIDNTIAVLVEGSFLPLSVIIIGVGKAVFANMDVLDIDDDYLFNERASKICIICSFLKYESGQKLANEILREIPRQIIEYYEQNYLDI